MGLAIYPLKIRYLMFIMWQGIISIFSLFSGTLMCSSREMSHVLLVFMLSRVVYNGATRMKHMIQIWKRDSSLKVLEFLAHGQLDDLKHYFHLHHPTDDDDDPSIKVQHNLIKFEKFLSIIQSDTLHVSSHSDE